MASIAAVDGLDLSAVRLFLAAVELGSVSKAASRMRITQPSATAKLQKLERQLGAPLLERSPLGSVPTVAGTRLTTSCADVLDVASTLLDRANVLHSERERLTIAATRHVADHFLPMWVSASDLADVDLDLVETDTMHVARAVRSGEADLGFTEGPAGPIGLRSELVAVEHIAAVVGRRHPWYGRRSVVGATELGAATLILGRSGSGTRDIVESALGDLGIAKIDDLVEVPNASAGRLAALNGSGVAFLPECWIVDHLADGGLLSVPARALRLEQPVRAVWRGTQPATGPARALLQAIRDR